MFYPVSDEEADEAKAICDQCAVREACLEFALANREREGIWGGATDASGAASTASVASPPDSHVVGPGRRVRIPAGRSRSRR